MKYLHDDKGRVERFGLPVLRPRQGRPACEKCPKVPGDAPVKSRFAAVSLDDRTRAALDFYRRCRAVNRFPDDEAVEAVAGIVDETLRMCDRVAEDRRFTQLGWALVGGMGANRGK